MRAQKIAMAISALLYGMMLRNIQHTSAAFAPRVGRLYNIPFSSHSLCGGASAFDTRTSSQTCARGIGSIETRVSARTILKIKDSGTDDDDDEEFEYARVRRGRGRQRYADYDDDTERSKTTAADDVGRERDRERENEYYDEVDYDDDGFDEDDEYDDDDDDDDEFDGIIPNVQLDSIDPDGSIERLSDLFSDPKFWRDTVILLLVFSAGSLDNPLDGVRMQDIDFSQFYAN